MPSLNTFFGYDERKFNVQPDEALEKVEVLVKASRESISHAFDLDWNEKAARHVDSLTAVLAFLRDARTKGEPLPRGVKATIKRAKTFAGSAERASTAYVALYLARRFLEVEGIKWGRVGP